MLVEKLIFYVALKEDELLVANKKSSEAWSNFSAHRYAVDLFIVGLAKWGTIKWQLLVSKLVRLIEGVHASVLGFLTVPNDWKKYVSAWSPSSLGMKTYNEVLSLVKIN